MEPNQSSKKNQHIISHRSQGEQLEKIIENIKVPPEQKPVFLSSFGKIMLATVITGVVVVGGLSISSLGHTLTPEQRDRIYEMQRKQQIAELLNDVNDPNEPEANSNITDSETEVNGK